MSPVIFRVTKDGNPAEITVYLGRIKKYVAPRSSRASDLDALDDFFLGTTLPVPDLEGWAVTKSRSDGCSRPDKSSEPIRAFKIGHGKVGP